MSELPKFTERNVPQLSLDEVKAIAADHFGLCGELKPLSGERDLNYRISTEGNDYVFKVGNVGDAEEIVQFQTSALRHIASRDPSLPIPRVIPDIEGNDFKKLMLESGASHIVRATTYLPGKPFDEATTDLKLWQEKGAMLGRISAALENFFHPAAASNDQPWDMARYARFQHLTSNIADPTARQLVDTVFARSESRVAPPLASLRRQVVHQDGHAGNVLVGEDPPTRISGIIDFGDMVYGSIAADLAVAADSTASDTATMIDAIAHLAIGYDTEYSLRPEEIDLIFDLVCARHALIATVMAARGSEPESFEDNIVALDRLLAIGANDCTKALRRACRFPAFVGGVNSDRADDSSEKTLRDKREQFLGRRATHFYDEIMHFEYARGVYLYSTDGHRYLDCYNNVPQVGHCNPHVVNAISRQAATLNTNTRYLYSAILEYAERLTDKLAPHLDVCIFVNSGSEANDIAWQMAKAVTGHSGGLLMEDAYHGITEPIREFSPGHPDVALPPQLAGLPVPDTYRALNLDSIGNDIDGAIAKLNEAGHQLAAFMIDSAFCSSGVIDAPAGYLQEVENRVRAAGGLMICDEVQSGFGRMGEWWGHEYHSVTADIVTMGKPVANGHPLGVVVTSTAILDAFNEKTRVFSTFGGNTVACAAGNAVLDVIEREDLIANGNENGDYLRSELRRLAKTQELIGDVRGTGMLTGLEFVTDRDTREPATAETSELLELMRQRRVLVGSEGRHSNILKLRPPLVFQKQHVDEFVGALDDALTVLATR